MSDAETTRVLQAIGRLQAQIEAIHNDNSRAAESRQEIRRELREIRDTTAKLADHAERLARLETQIRGLQDLRNKGTGIVVGVLIAAGAMGSAAWQWLRTFLGGGGPS